MALTLKSSNGMDGPAQLVVAQPIEPSQDLDELIKFRDIFDENMPSSRKPIRHDSTSVLLLSWDCEEEGFTDFDVREEVGQLEDVFRNDYGFNVERQVIKNGASPQLQMQMYLATFVLQHGKNHALLIVYYAGHGWHSSDRERSRDLGRPGFDLHPRQLEFREEPNPDNLVMWEVAEATLYQVKCDVLVIFDCCDAGSLQFRSASRAFEYLGACDKGKYTHRQSERSFTSGMTWALKKLRSEPFFTTATLRDKIKEWKHFPSGQQPVLFARFDLPEHIWISSMRKDVTPTPKRRRSSTAPESPELRDENCDFVDFRVFFNKHLTSEDAKLVANLMSPVVNSRKPPLNARHVSVLNKSTCQSRRTLGAHWRRAKRLVLAQRFVKQLSQDEGIDDSGPRKRPRDSFEGDDEEAFPGGGIIDMVQRPVTPISEARDSGTEAPPTLRIETGIQSPPKKRVRHDPVDVGEALIRDLESLEQNARLRPDLHGVLLPRIRTMKAALQESE